MKIFNNKGNTAIEYALIALFIGLAIISGTILTGTNTKQTFCTIASAIGAGSGNCSSNSNNSNDKNTHIDTSNYQVFLLKEGMQFEFFVNSNNASKDMNSSLSKNNTIFTDTNDNQIKTLGDLDNYFSNYQAEMHSKYDTSLGADWVNSVFSGQYNGTDKDSYDTDNNINDERAYAYADISNNAPQINVLQPKS